MKKTLVELDSDRLLSFVNTTGFKETLGAWISQGKRDVMLKLTEVNDPAEQQKAVGEFRAYYHLEQRIISIIAGGERARLARNEKIIRMNKDE